MALTDNFFPVGEVVGVAPLAFRATTALYWEGLLSGERVVSASRCRFLL